MTRLDEREREKEADGGAIQFLEYIVSGFTVYHKNDDEVLSKIDRLELK